MSAESSLVGWPVSAWKDLVEAGAVCVGGVWAYMLFVRGRQRYPRASIAHSITHRLVPDGRALLRVVATIANPGVILLSLRYADAWVQQVLPLAEGIEDLATTEDGEGQREPEFKWPQIGPRLECFWQKEDFEIEPGENDQVTWEFFIDKDVETVVVYTYFQNVKKRRREIGWRLTTLYDLKETPPGKIVKSQAADLTGKGH